MDETNTVNLQHPVDNPLHMEPFETRQIEIDGMTCDQCVEKVERALRNQRGVKDVAVDRPNSLATVTFDRSQTNIPALHDALLQAGYKPKALADEDVLPR